MKKSAVENAATPVRSRRGRKPRNKAVLDFTIGDAIINEYEPQLAEIQATSNEKRSGARLAGEVLPRTDLAPHIQAAEAMQKTRKELGNISAKRLLNLMSEFRHCKVSASDEIPLDDRDPPDHLLPEDPPRMVPFD
jgi:hypothetical protein